MKDLRERLFNFAVDVIKFSRTLSKSKENDVIIHQLIKSVTSAPANYEESQAAVSGADFKYKVSLALKEMRETNFWLRILDAIGNYSNELKSLVNESEELKKILGSICTKISKANK
jgi:four helix bundle protein